MAVSLHNVSRIKEVVTTWSNIRQMLRAGDEQGNLVPVVIPKDKRGFGWVAWLCLAVYVFVGSLFTGLGLFIGLGFIVAMFLVLIGWMSLWKSMVVEIEQGTTGIKSTFGKITGTLSPGRHFLIWPWHKVEYIVDTSTEIPYTAPVLACPTQENVPLKSIEFFLKFRIVEPVKFVRNIGASNYDVVLSSAVQDAIRRRTRMIRTEDAYDLRGSDVGDMQKYLNNQMQRYGVRITGANIPDVQLPDQYQDDLATRERVAKEQVAYEKEWELTRQQRMDTLLMEIERSKKERDEKLIAVKEATNRARESVAQMLQEHEAEAEKVRLDIEAKGWAELKAAENEARALTSLGRAYQDNKAVLRYNLALRRLDVAQALMQHAPRPIVVNGDAKENSSIATLLIAQALPKIMQESRPSESSNGQGKGKSDLLKNIAATY